MVTKIRINQLTDFIFYRFAILKYSTKERAEDTILRLNGHVIYGRKLKAFYSKHNSGIYSSNDLNTENQNAETFMPFLQPPNEFEEDSSSETLDLKEEKSFDVIATESKEKIQSFYGITGEKDLCSVTGSLSVKENISNGSKISNEEVFLSDSKDSELGPFNCIQVSHSNISIDEEMCHSVSQVPDITETRQVMGRDSQTSQLECFDCILGATSRNNISSVHPDLHDNGRSSTISQNSVSEYDISEYLSKGDCTVSFTNRAIDSLLKFSPMSKVPCYRLKNLEGPEMCKCVITDMLHQDPWKSRLVRSGIEGKVFNMSIDQLYVTVWYDTDDHVAEVIKIKPDV